MSLVIAFLKGDVSLWFGVFIGLSAWLVLAVPMYIVGVIVNIAYLGSWLLIKLGLNKATGGRIAWLARAEARFQNARRRRRQG